LRAMLWDAWADKHEVFTETDWVSATGGMHLILEGDDGTIVSLRRFKDDVQTVATGYECGIGLANFRDIKEGDTIESYEVREVART